jgi:hypothetical protein
MPIEVNITKRERIYINPDNATRIPKITPGLINVADVGKPEEVGGAAEEAGTEKES